MITTCMYFVGCAMIVVGVMLVCKASFKQGIDVPLNLNFSRSLPDGNYRIETDPDAETVVLKQNGEIKMEFVRKKNPKGASSQTISHEMWVDGQPDATDSMVTK